MFGINRLTREMRWIDKELRKLNMSIEATDRSVDSVSVNLCNIMKRPEGVRIMPCSCERCAPGHLPVYGEVRLYESGKPRCDSCGREYEFPKLTPVERRKVKRS